MAALREALLPLEGAPDTRMAATVVTANDVRAATLLSLPRPALPAANAAPSPQQAVLGIRPIVWGDGPFVAGVAPYALEAVLEAAGIA
eukprot:6241282-Alexandrium_andersonii.AAC.1